MTYTTPYLEAVERIRTLERENRELRDRLENRGLPPPKHIYGPFVRPPEQYIYTANGHDYERRYR